jgi:hypothetical protein
MNLITPPQLPPSTAIPRVANPVDLPEDSTTEYARVRASTENTEKKLQKISVNSAFSVVKGFPG